VTIIYLLFAGGLGVGLLFKQSFLKTLLSEAIQLYDDGWRKLTIRWIVFFLLLAGANEIIWRYFSENLWVNFKLSIIPLTFIFMLTQIGLLQKYQIPEEAADATSSK
jgi:intracellular septation protein